MRAEYVMGAKSILEGNPAPSPTSTTVTTTTKGGRSSSNLPSMGDFDKALAKSLTGSVDLKEVKDALSPYQMMLPEIKKNILDIKDADLGGALAMKGERQVKQEIEDINKSLIQQQKAYQLAGPSQVSLSASPPHRHRRTRQARVGAGSHGWLPAHPPWLPPSPPSTR